MLSYYARSVVYQKNGMVFKVCSNIAEMHAETPFQCRRMLCGVQRCFLDGRKAVYNNNIFCITAGPASALGRLATVYTLSDLSGVRLHQHWPVSVVVASTPTYPKHTVNPKKTLASVTARSAWFFFVVGYKGGKIYWLAIHSNQANLIVGGLRHRRHQQTRQAPLFQEVPSTRTKNSRGVEPLHPLGVL
jgi:hypothetical protein